ncbi:hypothetical protein MHYP_G00299820 [Metynnis hypsauchen]
MCPEKGSSSACISPLHRRKGTSLAKQSTETFIMVTRKASSTQQDDVGELRRVNYASERYHAGEETQEQASTSSTSVDQLAAMFQMFLIEQQERYEQWQKEAGKQEQRWRSLQHQFTLLQQMTQSEKHERTLSADDREVAAHENPTRILRHSGETTNGGRRVITSSQDRSMLHAVYRPTPRLPELKESDDIEHYLAMFERVAQTAGWPPKDWAIHLVPALEVILRPVYGTISLRINPKSYYSDVT